jgi:hypothetical protein
MVRRVKSSISSPPLVLFPFPTSIGAEKKGDTQNSIQSGKGIVVLHTAYNSGNQPDDTYGQTYYNMAHYFSLLRRFFISFTSLIIKSRCTL